MKLAALSLFILAPAAAAQTTERVSVNSAGAEANNFSSFPAISADGNTVAFTSAASNLTLVGQSPWEKVFIHDRSSGNTLLISKNEFGLAPTGHCRDVAISADGQFVAFSSSASDIVANDTNGVSDVFIYDRLAGQMTLASVSSVGVQGDGDSSRPSISADGRYLAFESRSTNLDASDDDEQLDIYVYDRLTQKTTLVSQGKRGLAGNLNSTKPSISADGKFIAFQSTATDLVNDDTNMSQDIFVRNRLLDSIKRVSLTSQGDEVFGRCSNPSISGDGSVVIFDCDSDAMSSADTNGVADVYLHTRSSKVTEMVSFSSSGQLSDGVSIAGQISASGRFITFSSEATNLVGDDLNGESDIFVRDLVTATTHLMSRSTAGEIGNADSYAPGLSSDGSKVTFFSDSSNLVLGDSNQVTDVFVRDSGFSVRRDSIVLVGPYKAKTRDGVELKWFAAPPFSKYWLAYSLNKQGSVINGYEFGLGEPFTVISVGVNSKFGTGSFVTAPLPINLAGLTLFYELGSRSQMTPMHDSFVHRVAVQ